MAALSWEFIIGLTVLYTFSCWSGHTIFCSVLLASFNGVDVVIVAKQQTIAACAEELLTLLSKILFPYTTRRLIKHFYVSKWNLLTFVYSRWASFTAIQLEIGYTAYKQILNLKFNRKIAIQPVMQAWCWPMYSSTQSHLRQPISAIKTMKRRHKCWKSCSMKPTWGLHTAL